MVLPPGGEYIVYCMACMGVLVIPALLPPEYQQAQMTRPRRLTRSHGVSRTRGPARAERKAAWRVNIERGWVPGDEYIGGT